MEQYITWHNLLGIQLDSFIHYIVSAFENLLVKLGLAQYWALRKCFLLTNFKDAKSIIKIQILYLILYTYYQHAFWTFTTSFAYEKKLHVSRLFYLCFWAHECWLSRVAKILAGYLFITEWIRNGRNSWMQSLCNFWIHFAVRKCTIVLVS